MVGRHRAALRHTAVLPRVVSAGDAAWRAGLVAAAALVAIPARLPVLDRVPPACHRTLVAVPVPGSRRELACDPAGQRRRCPAAVSRTRRRTACRGQAAGPPRVYRLGGPGSIAGRVPGPLRACQGATGRAPGQRDCGTERNRSDELTTVDHRITSCSRMFSDRPAIGLTSCDDGFHNVVIEDRCMLFLFWPVYDMIGVKGAIVRSPSAGRGTRC